MKILAIETSCDDTSCAVLGAEKSKIKVLSNIVSSQIKLHAKWGGVVPHLASREHAKNIDVVVETAMQKAGVKITDIDLIAVTSGPGLIVSLVIGVTFAKALSWKYGKPLIGINHMEGHIYSNWLGEAHITKKYFPIVSLAVSGGHTELALMADHGQYKVIGKTLDDAAGEAFDKIARILDLGYPGGPLISKLAEDGDASNYPLPSPMLNSGNYNFSFSGLKTAALYLVRDLQESRGKLTIQDKKDIAASSQKAIADVLISKTMRAAKNHKAKTIILSGGVSANKMLRERLLQSGKESKINVIIPELQYTTDNAAMIGAAAYYNWVYKKLDKRKPALSWQDIKPNSSWELI